MVNILDQHCIVGHENSFNCLCRSTSLAIKFVFLTYVLVLWPKLCLRKRVRSGELESAICRLDLSVKKTKSIIIIIIIIIIMTMIMIMIMITIIIMVIIIIIIIIIIIFNTYISNGKSFF